MSGPRAVITVGVDGASDSRRDIDSVGAALRRMNEASLQRVSSQLGALNSRIGGLQSTVGNVAAYTVAGISLMTLTDKIGGVLGKLGDLDDLAQKTGSSVEGLSRLQKVADAFGVDFGKVDAALSTLNKGLSGTDDESSKTRKALAALGLSARDSAGNLRDPAELMVDIAKRLQDYKDGAGKAALATDLFKKSGVDLLPYLNDVAESVDKFSSVSTEAASKAAAMQDKMGLLRVRSDELFTSIAVAGLPAMNDLASGILDVATAQDDLIGSDGASWADDMAVGVARVVDVVTLLPRLISAVSGSFKVVAADVEMLATIQENANPVMAAIKWAKGGNPVEDIRKAVAERNKVLEDANAQYDQLWNQPANRYEQAVLARIAGRASSSAAPKPSAPEKPTPNYTAGKDSDAEAAEKAAEAYRNLTASIQSKIAQSRIEATTGKAATAAQQEQIRLNEQLAAGKLSLSPKQRQVVDGMLQELDANNAVIESNKRAAEGRAGWDKILKEYQDTVAKTLADATAEAARNEELARTFGLTKSAIEQAELARLKGQLSQRSSLGLTLDEIKNLEDLIAVKERSSAALSSIESGEAAQKAGEALDKFLDPTKAQTFGEALKGAFDSAGDSMNQIISALDVYTIRQAEVEKARKDAAVKYAKDAKGYAAASEAITREEVKGRVSAYGDMAGAAKGFFSEGSKGYRVLETAEKAFRVYELAMAAETLTKKLFFKESEVAANVALNATKLSGEAATTAASAGLAATEASAWGITAVVKAIASLPFPLNLAAGAATMAAVVAVGAKMFGGGGGGSVSLSESRQKNQGTGSVFGDPDAKSESIGKSLDLIESNTYQGLTISMGMLDALTDIKNNIGSFAALVVRDTNTTGRSVAGDLGPGSAEKLLDSTLGTFLTGGFIGLALDKVLGGWVSKTLGKVGNSIFGGKKTLEDSGFTIAPASLSAILGGGLNAQSYADIKKSGGWFSSDKTSTQTASLGDDANRQITAVLKSLANGVKAASAALGLPTDEFTTKLDGFVVDIGKISFKDMKPAEIEEALQAVFSKLGDEMAQFAIGGLEQFQQVGEGYLETLTRIAQDYQAVDVVLQSVGMAFDSVGLGSVAARERLIELSGGLDSFVKSGEDFLRDFFSEAEQANALKARVQPMLDQYGLQASGENALSQFRDFFVALNPATEEGAKAFAVLSQLAPAIKQIADAEQYIYDERRDLQDQLDEITLTEVQLLEKRRNALHESNRALFDQINVLEAQRAAIQAAKDNASDLLSGVDSAYSALQSVVSREKGLLQKRIQNEQALISKHQALSSALRSALDGAKGPGLEIGDRQSAQAEIRTALAIAKAGGGLPDAGSLSKALSVVGQDASAFFATQKEYLRDFYTTQNDIAGLAGATDKALTVEERSLAELQKQVVSLDAILENGQAQIEALKGQSTATLTLAQAMAALTTSIGAAKDNPIASSGGSIAKLYRELLGRAPDAAGLDFWKERLAQGMSLDAIRKSFLESDEYKGLKGIPAFAAGGDHAGGIRFVGERGPELEFTGPSRIASYEALMDRLAGPSGGDFAAVVAELRLLREQVRGLQVAAVRTADGVEQTAQHTEQLADQFENVTDGGNAMRSEVLP